MTKISTKRSSHYTAEDFKAAKADKVRMWRRDFPRLVTAYGFGLATEGAEFIRRIRKWTAPCHPMPEAVKEAVTRIYRDACLSKDIVSPLEVIAWGLDRPDLLYGPWTPETVAEVVEISRNLGVARIKFLKALKVLLKPTIQTRNFFREVVEKCQD